MDELYYIFAGDKGWWGNTGTYTTDFAAAKQFTREKAIAFCRQRAAAFASLPVMPVSESIATEVRVK